MEITKVIETAKANGYRAYEVEPYTDWAWLITPKGNVLGVCMSQWGTGVHFTLKYKPKRNCGTGCSCHESTDEWDLGVRNVTVDDLVKYELSGLEYARELNASFYGNAEEFLDYQRKFWDNKIREI